MSNGREDRRQPALRSAIKERKRQQRGGGGEKNQPSTISTYREMNYMYVCIMFVRSAVGPLKRKKLVISQ